MTTEHRCRKRAGAPPSQWLNLPVEGSGPWPVSETVQVFDGTELLLRPETRANRKSIHVKLERRSAAEARTLVERFLSMLVWCDGQRMRVAGDAGWVGPENGPLTSTVAPRRGDEWIFSRELPRDAKVQRALALYREGRTLNSVPHSFLAYYKVLNLFWNDKKEGKDAVNPLIEGLASWIPQMNDRLARGRVADLKKQWKYTSDREVAHYLYKRRCAVAHAFADPLVDPDDAKDLDVLAADREIMCEIAEQLIEQELKVSRSLLA